MGLGGGLFAFPFSRLTAAIFFVGDFNFLTDFSLELVEVDFGAPLSSSLESNDKVEPRSGE